MHKRLRPKQPGLFDSLTQADRVAHQPNILIKLKPLFDWEAFRPLVTSAKPPSKGPGGRPGFDEVFMLKVLVLQRIYRLSDEQTEFQIMDRASFQIFLGIGPADLVPDQKTIWAFKQPLIQRGAFEEIFSKLLKLLLDKGLRLSEGSLIDATIVPVPRQRNTKEETDLIRGGLTPEPWKDDPAKCAQKDTDAACTKKHGTHFFGYKMHAKVDAKTKLISKVLTSPANVHDSQMLEDLLEPSDTLVFADSGYYGAPIENILKKNGTVGKICIKGRRNHPLTTEERATNNAISTVRARVEHVFGTVNVMMHGFRQRCIGLVRNEAMITFTATIYNMIRATYLLKASKA